MNFILKKLTSCTASDWEKKFINICEFHLLIINLVGSNDDEENKKVFVAGLMFIYLSAGPSPGSGGFTAEMSIKFIGKKG